MTNQKIPDYRCKNQYETLPESGTRSAIEVEHVVSCYQNSNASGPRVLSHVAVFQNARVNFAIPKNCSPTILAVELGVDKEIEGLLAVATVDDLYYWDPRTVQDGPGSYGQNIDFGRFGYHPNSGVLRKQKLTERENQISAHLARFSKSVK